MPPAQPSQDEIPILLVEDEFDDAALVVRSLRHGPWKVRHVRSGNDALAAARTYAPRLALLDHRLPDISGVRLCKQMRNAGLTMPIILMSSVRDDVVVNQAMAAGADDFLVKDVGFGDTLPHLLYGLLRT